MYEPIRSKSVHTTEEPANYPHRSREEELDIQLAGHLGALLAVTDELVARTPEPSLERAAHRLSERVARLRGGARPVRAAGTDRTDPDPERVEALHRQAHALAGRALVVAASRADTGAAILAAERMDAHAEALEAAPAALSAAG